MKLISSYIIVILLACFSVSAVVIHSETCKLQLFGDGGFK